MTLTEPDLAYAAALIDAFGRLTSRTVGGTELPQVTIQGRIEALDWLAEATGTKVVQIEKGYNKHQCAEHCTEKHTRVDSTTGRWSVTGARATIVLHNVEPYMRVRGRVARDLVEAGQAIGYKTQVVNDMVRLGWAIPDLKEQPRARLVSVAAGRMPT